MGCLNSKGNFTHWFGNIHLSGPCNRSCYFCIGQHMMAFDSLNVLDQWPLINIDRFVDDCYAKSISEINLTGSNTDPMLYKHIDRLYNYLYETVPNLRFGIRTNGIKILDLPPYLSGMNTLSGLFYRQPATGLVQQIEMLYQ